MNAVLENGRELTVNIFKPGSYFPMIWAITNIANIYYYQTATAVELQRAPRDLLLEFIGKNPDALFDLTKRILIGISGLLVNIQHQLSGDSYHRVVAALVLAAKRFGKENGRKEIIIKLPLTHEEIANLAGLTRETVSIAMEQLRKDKLIAQKNKFIVIKDVKRLGKESFIYEDEKQHSFTL